MRSGLSFLFWIPCVWLLPFSALAATAQLSAPADVSALLNTYLVLEAEGGFAHLPTREAFERRMQREVANLLATEGYFSTSVTLAEQGGEWRLIVEPGARLPVSWVAIEIAGDLDVERRAALLADWKLKVGSPFRQSDWDDAKQSLLRELLATDRAAARLLESRAEVDVDAGQVNLLVRIDAGPKYRFGEISIVGLSRYQAALVERFNRSVRAGDPYSEGKLLELQTALQNTPYFTSVSVEIDGGAAEGVPDTQSVGAAQGVVVAPVRIEVRERDPYKLSLGAGISSNTGARVEAEFRSTDLFRRAWELNTGLRLEQLRQTAYADIFLPPSSRDARESLGVAVENSEIQGLGIQRVAIGSSRVQRRGSIEQSLGVNWQEEKQTPKDALQSSNRALTAQVGWVWRHAHDPLDPAEGISTQLQLGGASKALLSDQSFVRSYLRYQQGIPLGARDGLLLRGEMGATLAHSRQGIPQDFLFRAGGTNSVRGYDYRSLGVKEGGATLGGRYLLTMSAEYTHWLDASWGAAVFVDAGAAGDDGMDKLARNLATAFGIGARWRSPAGPFAFDLAWGQRDSQLRVHFSLAVPF